MLKKVKKIKKKKSKEVKKKVKKKTTSVSPPLKTRHRLRNQCHPSLFSTQHQCLHRCHPNLTQQHNTSPPLEDTGASLTTLTCQCHPLTTNTCHTPCNTTHNTGAHTGAIPTSRNNDTGASLTTPHLPVQSITTPTHWCATPPPTPLTPPPRNTNHSPTATPLTQYCTACEMKSEGNMVMCS